MDWKMLKPNMINTGLAVATAVILGLMLGLPAYKCLTAPHIEGMIYSPCPWPFTFIIAAVLVVYVIASIFAPKAKRGSKK